MMAKILKVDKKNSLKSAIDLGIAMQLTNISRDVIEDSKNNRFYINENFEKISGAKNKIDAKRFLIFLSRADVQEEMNKTLGQLPVNSGSKVNRDPFLEAGLDMLNNAYAMAQFYDRDAPAEMASEGMKGFQEYMVNPDRRNKILERLEKVRQRVYK